MAAAEDMKATTGIYDAALGNRSNEASGVAIRQRQMESDVSTSIYTDNMAKAIATCGRILISMIPRIYDTQRVVKILGDDDAVKEVLINGTIMQDGQQMPVNDLSIGSYDLRVSTGPNYSTRRQETQEGMIEFIRAVPNAAGIIGDLVAKAMDWPDADKIAERLVKTLPPGLRNPEDMSPEEQQAMQGQQQQAQMAAQLQQAMQQIEMRQKAAEVSEAEADAAKAGADAMKAGSDAEKARYETAEMQLELLMKSGALNEAIAAAVQQQVARVLMSTPAPQGQFPT